MLLLRMRWHEKAFKDFRVWTPRSQSWDQMSRRSLVDRGLADAVDCHYLSRNNDGGSQLESSCSESDCQSIKGYLNILRPELRGQLLMKESSVVREVCCDEGRVFVCNLL